MSMSYDLFGDPIIKDVLLRDKYIEPPFTTLDARGGKWQKRKKEWKIRGIRSEVGRDDSLCLAQSMNKYDPRKSYTGTSIFDPVLCELMYRWFCPEGGHILDPFAGGSVRGIVASYLGYRYTGIELRSEQVKANYSNAAEVIKDDSPPTWVCGDSDSVLSGGDMPSCDMVFSCPPYFDLEKYSDDPNDLSNMTDREYGKKMRSVICKACNLLASEGYAVFVVGDVRDKNTGIYKRLPSLIMDCFDSCGYGLYNHAILLENGLNTAAMRADRQFSSGAKLVKVHQDVLVFSKR